MHYSRSTLIIPALTPDYELVHYVQSLIDNGFQHIIIVNDGSPQTYDDIFLVIQQKNECTVLRHDVNKGKGRAIKTAIDYYDNNNIDSVGVITVDADGQHSIDDVVLLDEALQSSDMNTIYLGVRDFSGNGTPFKSKFGNKITSRVIQLFHGRFLSDTQTGLRAFPNNLTKSLVGDISGERYEYEMNVLLYCIHHGFKIEEIVIKTIYHDVDNSCSHFRPLQDSLRIYSVILKSFFFYSISGVFSAVVDITIFTFLIKIIMGESGAEQIFIATAIARVCSSIFNYFINRKVAFGASGHVFISVIKYYSLCIAQLLVSASLVFVVHHALKVDETLVKAIIDGLLFFISYQIQKRWVFSPILKGG